MGKRKRNRTREKHKNNWGFDELDANTVFDDYEEKQFRAQKHERIRRKIREKLKNYTSKTESQRKLEKIIESSTITIGLGSAGTGKSYVALSKMLDIFTRSNGEYEKLIVFHPLIQVDDDNLGYLPGDVEQKINPFRGATEHTLTKILGEELVKELLNENYIEFHPINYVRGWTFDNNLLILEEGQNTSISQMKTLLTRVGENTKFVIIGDVKQSDRFQEGPSGLKDAYTRLSKVNGVGTFEFKPSDVVRSGIVSLILQEYEKDEKPKIKVPSKIKEFRRLEPVPTKKEAQSGGDTPVRRKRWWQIFG